MDRPRRHCPALPDELLGWLMLRGSSLSAAQRLNVLASIQNSLKKADVERGLPAMEDELRYMDRDGGSSKGKGCGRSFWVEQEGSWGILLAEEDQMDEFVNMEEVHWVEDSSKEVFHAMPHIKRSVPTRSAKYYYQDGAGAFWAGGQPCLSSRRNSARPTQPWTARFAPSRSLDN